MTEDKILGMVAKSDEFDQLKVSGCGFCCLPSGYFQVREDENSELSTLFGNCYLPVKEGVGDAHGKVNILLQSFISREVVESFSLTSDLSYIAQVMRGQGLEGHGLA